MPDKTWKQNERSIAAIFGTVRRPLSGMNSRSGGRDDSQHPRLYIEAKYRQKHTVWSLYLDSKEKADLENKTVVLGLRQAKLHGVLLVVHQSDFPMVAAEMFQANPELYEQFLTHYRKIGGKVE